MIDLFRQWQGQEFNDSILQWNVESDVSDPATIARQLIGLERYNSFDEINSDLQVQFALSQAYRSVDEIDPWIGLLAEEHVSGASVGETLFIIFKQQFEMLRDADRFWFERDFSGRDLEVIRNTTLADVISRNSGVRNMMPNVFFVPPIE